MKKVNEFFWFCAGANIEILRQCPTDHSKYFGIGGTIFTTSLMAMFAGGYAFNTAFDNLFLSIPFGVFWGLMIFNLDRYIVSSTGKGDGTSKITKEELQSAAPRLVMAILLGIVISMPLELKLFEKEINVEIDNIKQRIQAQKRSEVYAKHAELTQLDVAIGDLNTELKLKENKRDRLATDLEDEMGGVGRTGKIAYGPVAKQIKENLDRTNAELTELKSLNTKKIAELEANRASKMKTRDEELLLVEAVSKQYEGLMAKLEAFDNLTSEKISLRMAKWLVTLLFIVIEIAPVLFKMMTEKGPYDDIVDRMKHEVYVQQMHKISSVNDDINTNLSINVGKNKNRLEAELKANQELLTSIADAQAEIAGIAVKKWKEEELKKAEEKFGDIIKVYPTSVNGVTEKL
jgi:hypothetical protein